MEMEKMKEITIITEDTQKKFIFKNADDLKKAVDKKKIFTGLRWEDDNQVFYFENEESVVFSEYYNCYIDVDYTMFHQKEGYIFEYSEDFIQDYDGIVCYSDEVVFCEDVQSFVLEKNTYKTTKNGETVYFYYKDDLILNDNNEYIFVDEAVKIIFFDSITGKFFEDYKNINDVETNDSYIYVYDYDEDEETYYHLSAYQEKNKGCCIVNYKKTTLLPISEMKKKYYLGLEVEMEHKTANFQHMNEIIKKLIDSTGANNFYKKIIEWKKDSSLKNGVELVTAPLNFEEIKTYLPYIINKLKNSGFTADDEETTGIHIHVSKQNFTEEEQTRLILIYAKFEKYFKILSGRKRFNYCEDILKNEKLEITNSLEIAKNQKKKGRMTAINFNNENTIEFRIFQSTLNFEKITAYLQLVQFLMDLSTQNLSVQEILNLNFSDLKNLIQKENYKELLQLCNNKNL